MVSVPRERFSCTERSLASIVSDQTEPFDLVVVDGGSPSYVREHLQKRSTAGEFSLLREDKFLSPNAARNLGFSRVTTEYACFIDNDVVVEPGWLGKLVQAADEETADIVAPLYLIGELEDGRIHMAGGKTVLVDSNGERLFREIHHHDGDLLAEVKDSLERHETDHGEFHCLLVRSSSLRDLGPFDEELLSTREHVDFCMQARNRGMKILFEPRSVVTYLATSEFVFSDLPFFATRWGHEWNKRSVERFWSKWNLTRGQRSEHYQLFWLDNHRRMIHLEPRLEPQSLRQKRPNGHLEAFAMAYSGEQLLRQCGLLRFNQKELNRIRRSLDLATAAHRHQFAHDGTPLINHLITTSSILAGHAAPAQLVACALLHSIYRCSDSGEAHPPDEEQRKAVRTFAGREMERILHAYDQMCRGIMPAFEADDDLDRLPLSFIKAVIIKLASLTSDAAGISGLQKCPVSGGTDGQVLDARLLRIVHRCGYGPLLQEWQRRSAVPLQHPPLQTQKNHADVAACVSVLRRIPAPLPA